ncbi:MAG TPA: FecR domain-containing protein [Rhodanobacter sp.]
MNDGCRSTSHVTRRAIEQAACWYLDQREGLSPARQRDFLAWLRHSPLHVAEYLAIAQLHGDLKAAATMEAMSTTQLAALAASESAIVSLRPGITSMPSTPLQPRRVPRARKLRRWGAVASVVAMLSTAAWLLVPGSHDTPADIYASSADAGRSLQLADGSLVQLDRDSAITVRFDAQRRRIQIIRGGALFDVGKDLSRPLQVQLGDSQLQDIGTVFSARRQASGGIVTVLSGQVNLLAPAHPWVAAWQHRLGRIPVPDTVVAALGSGQQAVFDGDGAVTALTTHVDIAQATAWLPADLRFQHSTVAEVARRFNAYTLRPLVIDDPKVAAMRISGLFHAHDAEAFAAYLASLPGVQVQHDDHCIRVSGATPAATHRRRRL